MKSRRYAQVNEKRCVSCGACTKECPREAVSVWKGCFAVVDPEHCIGCGRCEKICPVGCIDMKERAAS